MNWKHQNKISAFFILSMIFVALQYFGASTAFAEFGFAPPPATDMSRSFLNQIFGSLLDSGTDAYGASIRNFNGAVLVIGGILAAYTIFAGTLGTAHDGEMLGKKFSSVWIPIRYVLGTALVLPIFSGGYCGMQVIVMWLIMQGVSVANGVWEEYMKDPPGLRALVSEVPPTELLSLIENIYMAQVCAVAHERSRNPTTVEGPYLHRGNKNANSALVREKRKHPTVKDEEYWYIGTKGGKLTCGQIFFPNNVISNTNTSKTSVISQTVSGKTYDIPGFADLKDAFKTPDYSSLVTAHRDAIGSILLPKTQAMAEKYVGTITTAEITPANIPDNAYDGIYEIAQNYQSKIREAAQKAIDENTGTGTIGDAASKQGWFLAGAWATQIILAQNKLNVALNAYGSIENLQLTPEKGSVVTDFNEMAKPALQFIATRNTTASSFISKDEAKDNKSNKNLDLGGKVAVMLSNLITGLDITAIKEDKRHPIIIMSTVGNAILNSVINGTIAIMGIALGAGALGFVIDSVPSFITFYGTFAIPLAGFIGAGATLAYLIPNLPFLLWIGIIIGWSVMCIEAIIAAPLWAVMHLHPNGDDLTGRGGNGYMLVLGLLLRPVLIIFGLISAIVLSGLFGQLVNIIFLDTFTLNMGDGKLGFFAILFSTGLYAAVMMTVIKQCFQLMHAIPDQLMRWIGGGQEQLGQYAGASADSMTKASTIGAAAVGLVAEKGVNSLQAGAANYQRQKEGQKAAQAAKQDSYMKADEKYGAGSGASFASIDSKGGGSGSLSAQQQKSELGQMLGSMSPQQAASFNTHFNKPENEKLSYPERRDAALEGSLKSQYGGGVADMVGKLSGGAGTSGTAGSKFGSNGLEVAKSIATVTALKDKLDKSGMDGAQVASTLNNVCTSAESAYKNSLQQPSGNAISLKNAFKNEASKY